jgi:hypothetical protein
MTMTSRVQLKKILPVVSLKRLDTKTNRMGVNLSPKVTLTL